MGKCTGENGRGTRPECTGVENTGVAPHVGFPGGPLTKTRGHLWGRAYTGTQTSGISRCIVKKGGECTWDVGSGRGEVQPFAGSARPFDVRFCLLKGQPSEASVRFFHRVCLTTPLHLGPSKGPTDRADHIDIASRWTGDCQPLWHIGFRDLVGGNTTGRAG